MRLANIENESLSGLTSHSVEIGRRREMAVNESATVT